eukprot:Pompholyxophrys_punicea_v1_NODE_447_length_1949_cov_4.777719.p2 type:complete len:215 gc:universal NODE_447_length_1949_cov_4.777719:1925-1281(-)
MIGSRRGTGIIVNCALLPIHKARLDRALASFFAKNRNISSSYKSDISPAPKRIWGSEVPLTNIEKEKSKVYTGNTSERRFTSNSSSSTSSSSSSSISSFFPTNPNTTTAVVAHDFDVDSNASSAPLVVPLATTTTASAHATTTTAPTTSATTPTTSTTTPTLTIANMITATTTTPTSMFAALVLTGMILNNSSSVWALNGMSLLFQRSGATRLT